MPQPANNAPRQPVKECCDDLSLQNDKEETRKEWTDRVKKTECTAQAPHAAAQSMDDEMQVVPTASMTKE